MNIQSNICGAGERMAPAYADAPTFWHHVYRYRFAAAQARGRRVLDVACGEGYGCRALADAGATQVIGIDASPEAVQHARKRYGVDARVGSAEALPLPDASVELVVSFETIEHLDDPARFLSECARVLVPRGLLILSSPDRDLYRLRNGINPFHRSEMSEAEMRTLISRYFQIEGAYGQYPELSARGLLDLRMWTFLPWVRLTGINRLRRHMMARPSNVLSSVPASHANDAPLAVKTPLPGEGRAWNPNVLRPRIPSPHLRFVFLLFVARRME